MDRKKKLKIRRVYLASCISRVNDITSLYPYYDLIHKTIMLEPHYTNINIM